MTVCPCAQAIALLDSAERAFRRVSRGGDVPTGVAASWLAEREKLAACPCAAARPPAGSTAVSGATKPDGDRP